MSQVWVWQKSVTKTLGVPGFDFLTCCNDDCIWSFSRKFFFLFWKQINNEYFPNSALWTSLSTNIVDLFINIFFCQNALLKIALFIFRNFFYQIGNKNMKHLRLIYRIYSRVSQPAYKLKWKNIWKKMTKIEKKYFVLYVFQCCWNAQISY